LPKLNPEEFKEEKPKELGTLERITMEILSKKNSPKELTNPGHNSIQN
jgi:hypothetical protein